MFQNVEICFKMSNFPTALVAGVSKCRDLIQNVELSNSSGSLVAGVSKCRDLFQNVEIALLIRSRG